MNSEKSIFFDPRRIELINPSQQDIDRSNPVRGNLNGQEGRITTPIAITLASIAGLGAGGVGGWFINDAFGAEKPSETIPVGSFENSFNNPGPQIVHSERVKKPNKDGVFDPNAERQVITPSMIKRVPKEELQQLDTFGKLRKDGKKEIITLSQPILQADRDANPNTTFPDIQVEVREDKGTIEILYPLDLSQSDHPDAEIELIKSFNGVTGTQGKAFQGKGYYDTFEFKGKGNSGIPERTIVKMPVVSENGGYLIMSTMGDGMIDFQSSNGYTYRILIVGVDGNDKVVPFKPLVDAPEWTPEFKRIPIGSGGLFVISNQQLLQTTQKLDKITVRIIGGIKPGTKPILLTDVKIFVSPDGKFVAPE